jgi:tetratricopeptide (TPR) repeat protein
MFPGASATFYRGHNRYPTIGGGYLPYYGTYSLGVPYSPYYYGTYGFAPLFVPADSLFGPGPLMQNIGNLVPADDGGNLPRLPRNLPAPKQQAGQQAGQAQQAAQGAGVANPPAQKKVRVTNAASKARAGKFLQSGDTQFGKQKFHQALERYREGALSAPDLGDCYFRQAFAQVAMGQYDAASKAIQRGLRLQPNWADSAFTLDSLYGAGHHLEKLSHREGLAQAIEQNPLDAGLYLAMGALLYFDGEHERSRPFFERAAQIGGNDDHLLDGFLAPMPADAGNDAAGKNAADRDAAAKGAADKAAARPAGKVNL